MGHEIVVHTEVVPDAVALRERFTALFARASIDPSPWEGPDRSASITWSALGRGTIAIDVHTEERAPEGRRPARAKGKLFAAARWALTIPVDEGPELAAAWAVAAALADAGRGLVLDPFDGAWHTSAEAQRVAAREARSMVGEPSSDEPDSSWARIARAEYDEQERTSMFDAALARVLDRDAELAALVAANAADDALLGRALEAIRDHGGGRALRVVSDAIGPARLGDHLRGAVRSPSFRIRHLVELLFDAGALDALDGAQRTAILATAREWKNRDVVDELTRRGW